MNKTKVFAWVVVAIFAVGVLASQFDNFNQATTEVANTTYWGNPSTSYNGG